MDTFEALTERFYSFNIPKRVLALYHNNKDKISQAYAFCINQAKLNNHHILYKKLHDEAVSKGLKMDSQGDYDPDWYNKKDQEYKTEYTKKENELKSNTTTGIKPSIQMSYVELAKLNIRAGDFKGFEQAVLKAREIQPLSSEAAYLLKVLLLHNGQFEDVKKFIRDNEMGENFTTMAFEHKSAYCHARAIHGILNLRLKDYHAALSAFTEINPDHVQDIGLYSSFADIAKYLVILSIICYKREEIKEKVFVGNAKQILTFNAVAQKLLDTYLFANYEEFSNSLEKIMVDWSCDPYVENIKSSINEMVLDRALKQYLNTISRVKIETAAATFRILPEQCEEVCRNLILTKQIPFRIDRLEKILIARDEDQHNKEELVKKATRMVGNYCFEKQFAVLKVGYTQVTGSRHKGKGGFDSFE